MEHVFEKGVTCADLRWGLACRSAGTLRGSRSYAGETAWHMLFQGRAPRSCREPLLSVCYTSAKPPKVWCTESLDQRSLSVIGLWLS